jgi:hypothetical protein
MRLAAMAAFFGLATTLRCSAAADALRRKSLVVAYDQAGFARRAIATCGS